jgi:phosphoribosylamine---glycine ligase
VTPKGRLSVLLLGSGGREHALAWKLAQSPLLKKLYAAPGSDGIGTIAERVSVDMLDAAAVTAFAKKHKIDLVVIGPEAPLEKGVSDALRAAGFNVFGPSRAAARLETSKAFAKDFMKRHGLPTAKYEVFTEAWRARAAVEAMRLPFVVKADGLAAGKGVVVCKTTNEALGAVTDFMERKSLGAAGETVVVERGLAGPEVSVLVLCDGQSYKILPPACDHKRLNDNDEGPNTGGMGAYAPAQLDEKTLARIKAEVLDRALAGLSKDKLDYRGVLYAGLMLTETGPQLLEFNVRFGDPETQAILPLLKSDLLELLLACAEGRLADVDVEAHDGACVCVALASEGYPARPQTGRAIAGLDSVPKDAMVFHAGTTLEGKTWKTAGGRVLGVSALGKDIAEAREKAYAAAAKISFDGMHLRRDIAERVLALQ